MTLREAIEHCKEKSCGNTVCAQEYKQLAEWLKELRELRSQSQWKPSDKQILALRWVLNHIPYDSHKEEISGLLDQIKDL